MIYILIIDFRNKNINIDGIDLWADNSCFGEVGRKLGATFILMISELADKFNCERASIKAFIRRVKELLDACYDSLGAIIIEAPQEEDAAADAPMEDAQQLVATSPYNINDSQILY